MVIAVLQGSVRRERMGDRAARWVLAQLKARGHEAVMVDAASLEVPLLDKMWKEIKHDPPPQYADLYRKLAPLAELYARTDGYVAVSGEYNHSIPPALSNLIDHFLEEYAFRPAAIVCYSAGPFGGVRAAMQLRALLPEVGLSTIPSILPIPKIATALSPEGIAPNDVLARQSGKFFDEFEWYIRAMKAEREKGTPY
jgi:NAD(P)H-dependent FMN reductase